MKLSASKINSYNECSRKWNYRYNLNYTPELVPQELTIGTMVHTILEEFYRTENKEEFNLALRYDSAVDEAIEKYTKSVTEIFGMKPLPQLINAERESLEIYYDLLEAYVYHYSNKNLDNSTVEGIEYTFHVEIPGTQHTISGTIDLILRDRFDRLWIVDHKTYKMLPNYNFEVLLQPRIYLWALTQLFPQEEIAGYVYNGIRKKEIKSPKITKGGKISKVKVLTTPHVAQALINDNNLVGYTADMFYEPDWADNFFFRHLQQYDNLTTVLQNTEFELTHYASQMETGLYFPQQNWMGCGKCPYKTPCQQELNGEEPSFNGLAQNVDYTYQTDFAVEMGNVNLPLESYDNA